MAAALATLARRFETAPDAPSEQQLGGPGDRAAQAKQLLRRYDFDEALHETPVANLSGGERRRLQLMAALDVPSDLLILDEPSNDLDLETLQSLERYLLHDHAGKALLLVSHDRALLDAACDKLLVLPGDGYAADFGGSMSEYLDLLDEASPVLADDDDVDDESVVPGRDAKPRRGRDEAAARRKAKHNAPREIDKLAQAIEAKEADLAEIDRELERHASDVGALQDAYARRVVVQTAVDALYDRWAELEALLETDDEDR